MRGGWLVDGVVRWVMLKRNTTESSRPWIYHPVIPFSHVPQAAS